MERTDGERIVSWPNLEGIDSAIGAFVHQSAIFINSAELALLDEG